MEKNEKEFLEIFSEYPSKRIISLVSSNVIPIELKEKFIKNLQPLVKSKSDFRDYRNAKELNRGTGRIHDIVDPNLNSLEKTWISTEFYINKARSSLIGDINNIDRKLFPNLYNDIISIFNEILPCMYKLMDIDFLERILNVVVKIQSYELKENEDYEGKFHQEGFKDEGIFAIAIYYFHISSDLKGGDLEIRYPIGERIKNEEIDIYDYPMETKKIQVKENDVVLILNKKCEHRINKLERSNKDDKTISERKILVFFLMYPEETIVPTSKNIQVNKNITENEKDQIYIKRDEFRKTRRSNLNDLVFDLSEKNLLKIDDKKKSKEEKKNIDKKNIKIKNNSLQKNEIEKFKKIKDSANLNIVKEENKSEFQSQNSPTKNKNLIILNIQNKCLYERKKEENLEENKNQQKERIPLAVKTNKFKITVKPKELIKDIIKKVYKVVDFGRVQVDQDEIGLFYQKKRLLENHQIDFYKIPNEAEIRCVDMKADEKGD